MKNLEKQAIGIVAQLFDLAEVPVDKRQQINDVAYDYVTEQLIITNVSQQRELLELVTEIANSKQVYSNTRHKLWAKKLISSNCG
jgi:hypothetical protein